MGTRVAPSLANAFMDDFEHTHVYTHNIQPHTWIRYIDDVFCIWTEGEESFQAFVDHLNTCHESIKFTSEHSYTSVNFLDTTVGITDNRITTDLYTKPTDTHSYLRYDSAHNPGCKTSLPYGQFLRLRRICQTDALYKKHAVEMIGHFVRQGYPHSKVQQAMRKAQEKTRDQLISPTPRELVKEEKLFLITTYQPEFGALKDIVTSNWDLLKKSIATKKVADLKLIVGYRRPKNLRDLLFKAKLDYHPERAQNDQPVRDPSTPLNQCKRKDCRYCTKLDTSGRIKSSYTGREYMAKHNVSCQSNNLIYCITCKKCNVQYVGQTKRRLMDRFQGHFGVIQRNDPSSDIAAHFNSTNHNGTQDLKIHIGDFIFVHPDSQAGLSLRDHIEFNWIHRLHTQQPMGLNILETPPVERTPGTR
jgi:hypothetical protein